MSHYTSVSCEVNDKESFIDAIVKKWATARGITITRADVEVLDEPAHLYGYQGDQREQKANVIIRRNKVGSASNDVGWLVQNGKAEEFISDYDRGYYTLEWSRKLKGRYGLNVATKAGIKKGYEVTEELDELGNEQIRLSKRVRIGE